MSDRVESSWQARKIGDLFRINNTAWTPDPRSNMRVALYSLPSYDISKTYEFQNESSIESNKFLVSNDSLLVAKLNPRIVRVQVAVPQKMQTVCSTEFMCYEAKSEEANLAFFYYYCSSEIFYKRLREIASGSTNSHVRVTPAETLDFQISVPPLAEQKKIADILSSVDEVIENTESEISKLEDLKKATLNELLTKGIGHTEFKETEIGRIPKSWEVKFVEELFLIGRGRVISGQYLKAHSGPYPVYSSQSKNDGVFGFIDTYEFDGEHITWTTDGAYAGTVFYRSGKFNCTNVCGILTNRCPREISEQFAAYYLASVAKKHVSYVGNPKLMNNVFSQIPLVVPPLEEQLDISKAIASVERAIAVSQMKLCNLSSLKKSLMQDLLTGKVRVKVN